MWQMEVPVEEAAKMMSSRKTLVWLCRIWSQGRSLNGTTEAQEEALLEG